MIRPSERAIGARNGRLKLVLLVGIWLWHTTKLRIIWEVTKSFDLGDRNTHWGVLRRSAFPKVLLEADDVVLSDNLVDDILTIRAFQRSEQ